MARGVSVGDKGWIGVDLDGTLAFSNGQRGWYDTDVSKDIVSEILKEQVLFHYGKGRKILIVTGRDDKSDVSTRTWLKNKGVPYDHLYMRKFGDFRKDHIVKREIYESKIKNKYHHGSVRRGQVLPNNVRADEGLDEAADTAPADDPVQPLIDLFVHGDGELLLHLDSPYTYTTRAMASEQPIHTVWTASRSPRPAHELQRPLMSCSRPP